MKLLDEFLREMAVLIAVFVPLETAVQLQSLTVGVVSAIVVTVGGLFGVGVFLEVSNR